MHERTRYRVTGSIFLLALAVIFLPMIFDGAGAPSSSLAAAPPKPVIIPDVPDFDSVVPASDVVSEVTALRDSVDEEGFSTSDGTRFGEPVLAGVQAATDVFAVQAATFANEDNARAFRDRLRGAGFDAFISAARPQGGQAMHRVAIGPLLSSVDADGIKAEVDRRFDLDARVVAMVQ